MKFPIVLAAIFPLLAGCATQRGPALVPKHSFSYNQELRRSQNEQMLLNLVRLRYNDIPLFLELGSIVTQYVIQNEADLSAVLTLKNASNSKPTTETAPTLAVGRFFEERPTVTYLPLQGEDFARRILAPIPPETILLLSQSGWSISRLLSVCVQRINDIENAPTASGPTPASKPVFEQFTELATSFRILQKAGLLMADLTEKEGRPQAELILRKPSAEDTELTRYLKKVQQMLKLPAPEGHYPVVGGLIHRDAAKITLNTRSLLGVLFFLSHAVEPPIEHQEEGYVQMTRTPEGDPFDWKKLLGSLLRIRSQEDEPQKTFVKVYYRNYWFFIEDKDFNSKSTFGLLNYLLALQSAEGKGRSPFLALTTG